MEESLVLTNDETKRCSACGRYLDVLHFYKRGKGLQSKCIECDKDYKKKRRLESSKNLGGYLDVKLAEVPLVAKEMGKKQKTDLRNYLRYLSDKIK